MNDPINRRSLTALGLTGGALLATGAYAGPPQIDEKAILAEITEQRREFADILLRHDHDALPPMFTIDTIVLPAGRPLVQGRDAAIAFWTAATSDPKRRLRSAFDALDSLFAGDVVVETGRAKVFAVGNDGETLFDNGKYIVVWKREDGRWKRHRDIFNSDGPII